MLADSKKIFLVEGLRTPFTRAGKEFDQLHPSQLASENIRELLYKINFKGDEIDELILGNSFTLPDSPNIARVAALYAGLPKSISATTTLRNCASSMESFVTGTAKIQAGLYNNALVGGMESMSYAPFFLSRKLSKKLQNFLFSKGWKEKAKSLAQIKISDLKPQLPIVEGLKDPFTGYSMGETAELLAREFHITREEQDEFALLSHKKALQGEENLKEEIFPFFTEKQVVSKDTCPRKSLSKERLAKMKAFFDKKYGTVSIGNSCSINDGSSLVLLMSEEQSKALGLKPLASILHSSFTGLEPERMGLGPVYAIAKVLKETGLALKDMDLIEINEAFAAQVLACLKALSSKKFCEEKLQHSSALGEIPPEKLNVNGGAIAIGHPISATGTRIILTLAKEMKRRKVQFGLASLCIGGGQGGALILERTE